MTKENILTYRFYVNTSGSSLIFEQAPKVKGMDTYSVLFSLINR